MQEENVPTSTEPNPPSMEKKSFWSSVGELVRFALLAAVIVLPIRMFIAQPFIVSGSSMFPTFMDGEYLIVDELSYHLGNPKRDEVVIFKYPNDTKKYFIKRVIGLPYETVEIKGSAVTIINKENPKGFVLDQSYVKNTSENTLHFELGKDEYFVMGDNRSASSDSRYWGAVPRNLMVGKAFLRLFPVTKIDAFPGAYQEQITNK